MSEITLEAIEQLLDVKLDEKFDAKLAPIQKTLDDHTAALASLATDVKTLLQEKTVSAERFERLEHWAQQVGERLGTKLEI
jgi:cob(I)alamin adenosyltransferase